MGILTRGCHHVGLTVPDPGLSAGFFTGLLGWQEIRRDDDYPAIFVSDGVVMVSLWGVREPGKYRVFDRENNAGLHHLALAVDSEAALDEIYRRLAASAEVAIEFAPELLRQGPAKHLMCYEPGGLRIEFIWPGTPVAPHLRPVT